MPDTFIIFYEQKVLIVLTGLNIKVLPPIGNILDWYSREYAFDRERLTGLYTTSIDVSAISYNDFR